jgi:hypothetical protein
MITLQKTEPGTLNLQKITYHITRMILMIIQSLNLMFVNFLINLVFNTTNIGLSIVLPIVDENLLQIGGASIDFRPADLFRNIL